MDSYRNQADPYASSYDHPYDPRAYPPPSSYHQESSFHDAHRPPSRSSSISRPDSLPQPTHQPLHNALNNAFDKSDSASKVDPDIIAQITAEVKKSVLDEIKLSGVGVTGQPAPPHPYGPQGPQSPVSATSLPSRNVYTPPSPKPADFSSHRSESPDPLARDPMFDGADDTPTPRHERSAPVDIPQPQQRTTSRPAPAPRTSTDGDLSPIERRWQRLFDSQGHPTPRLGQFLRGLAIHLIDDYEPKKSLVIPPSKMLKFYNDVKLTEEIYPWQTIFGRLPYSTLGKLYREMRCQHHFIQEHTAESPYIPALTPDGFQEWMTAMIQAYPDTEYERLSKAVLDMPISNADDCKERFPKELPRRLFPGRDHLQAQQRCAAILSAENVGPLRRAPTFPPPPPMSQSVGSNGVPPTLERERSPYANRTDSKVFESEDEHDEPLSIPLERERKPYSAAPGGGKVYNDESTTSFNEQRHRAQSTASQNQWAAPPNVPPAQHYRTGSQATGRRPRSPSFPGYGTQSDPNIRDIPGSYHASNMFESEEERRRFAKDAEMRRNDWAGRHPPGDAPHHRRSTTTGTDSSYDSQPRSVYDDEYYRGRGSTNGYDNRYDSRRY